MAQTKMPQVLGVRCTEKVASLGSIVAWLDVRQEAFPLSLEILASLGPLSRSYLLLIQLCILGLQVGLLLLLLAFFGFAGCLAPTSSSPQLGVGQFLSTLGRNPYGNRTGLSKTGKLFFEFRLLPRQPKSRWSLVLVGALTDGCLGRKSGCSGVETLGSRSLSGGIAVLTDNTLAGVRVREEGVHGELF